MIRRELYYICQIARCLVCADWAVIAAKCSNKAFAIQDIPFSKQKKKATKKHKTKKSQKFRSRYGIDLYAGMAEERFHLP